MSKNIEINIKTESGDYETLYPKVNAVSSDISTEVSQQFGLENGSIDDVLKYLGKFNEYWWRRRTYQEVSGTVVLGDSVSKIYLAYSSGVYYGIDIEYSSEIKYPGMLVNPKTANSENDIDGAEFGAGIQGKYVHVISRMSLIVSDSWSIGDWYYIPNNPEEKTTTSGSKRLNWIEGKTFTWKVIPAQFGDWEYLHSIDKATYPNTGKTNGYEYEFLGKPFEKLPICTQYLIGSYTGTGAYGTDNPTVLKFDFIPKLIICNTLYWSSNGWQNSYIWTINNGVNTRAAGQNGSVTVSLNNTEISFVSTDDAMAQFNYSGTTYKYVAFG